MLWQQHLLSALILLSYSPSLQVINHLKTCRPLKEFSNGKAAPRKTMFCQSATFNVCIPGNEVKQQKLNCIYLPPNDIKSVNLVLLCKMKSRICRPNVVLTPFYGKTWQCYVLHKNARWLWDTSKTSSLLRFPMRPSIRITMHSMSIMEESCPNFKCKSLSGKACSNRERWMPIVCHPINFYVLNLFVIEHQWEVCEEKDNVGGGFLRSLPGGKDSLSFSALSESVTHSVYKYLVHLTLNFVMSPDFFIFTDLASFRLAVSRKSLISLICLGCK